MESEWPIVTVASIAKKVASGPFGSNLRGSEYVQTGVPVIRGGNLAGPRFTDEGYVYVTDAKAESLSSSLAYPLDIVFAARGSIGAVGLVPQGQHDRYLLSSNLVKVTVDSEKADPRFVFYYFRSWRGQHEILAHVNTTGVPKIERALESLRSFRLPRPPLHMQQAIACILGALDDKIELNRRMNETLEAMTQAIFKSWFVDFDPVRAKAAGQQPAGLAPHIADLFPDGFVGSELGEIPKGWQVCAVSELAQINEQSLGKGDPLDLIDYVEISKVMRGEISEIVRYERGTEPSRARRRLRHGDTVLSTVRPDRGAHFLCLDPPETLIASTGFAVLSPKDGCWAFLYTALTRPEIGETLGRLADGGAYPAIRPEVVGNLTIAIPGDPQLMQEFERIAEPLYQKAARNRDQSRTLAALRDTLLPKLISGELCVPDAEQFLDF